jgi:hypothetical protein
LGLWLVAEEIVASLVVNVILDDLVDKLLEIRTRVCQPDFSLGGDFHQREWEVRLMVAWELVESRVGWDIVFWFEGGQFLALLTLVGDDCVVDVVHTGERLTVRHAD